MMDDDEKGTVGRKERRRERCTLCSFALFFIKLQTAFDISFEGLGKRIYKGI